MRKLLVLGLVMGTLLGCDEFKAQEVQWEKAGIVSSALTPDGSYLVVVGWMKTGKISYWTGCTYQGEKE